MIRDLTDSEKATLSGRALCPFCGRLTSELMTRARGGLSANMYCPCGAGFNLAMFQGKYVVGELIAEPTAPIVWRIDYSMGHGYVCGECYRDGKGKHDDLVLTTTSPPDPVPPKGTKCDGCERLV